MNVLFCSSLPTVRSGGVAHWTHQIVTALRDMGHQVHVLTWGCAAPDRLSWGPDLHFVPLRSRLDRLPLVGFWYRLLSAAQAGRRLLRREEFQIIHTVSVHETFSASLARGSGAAAIVLSIHGDFVTEQDLWWKSRWRRRLYLPLERAALRSCDAIVTSSAWLQTRLPLSACDAHLAVIPNGIGVPPPETDWPDRRSLGLPEQRKIVLALNNLRSAHRRRGLELLITAAPRVLEQVPETLFLVVGGIDEPSTDQELVKWASKRAGGLPFEFTGFRPQPPYDLMMAADVYVHPSFLDNSPLSIMEAMALSRPVVATEVGGIPEMIDSGETGLLVPLEPEALAEAIVHVLLDPAYAHALGDRARQKALEAFSWTRSAAQFAELYEETSRRRRGRP